MKKWYSILPALLLVIIIIAGLFLKSKVVNNSKQTTKQILPLPKEILVTLDKNGFSPKEITIKPELDTIYTQYIKVAKIVLSTNRL